MLYEVLTVFFFPFSVCFVAAISEFDQVLYEDDTQNRLDESLDLFKQVAISLSLSLYIYIYRVNARERE